MAAPGMTDLERKVALRILRKDDPWEGTSRGRTRRISQAIGRLMRKGFVVLDHSTNIGEHTLTDAGRRYLEGHPPLPETPSA